MRILLCCLLALNLSVACSKKAVKTNGQIPADPNAKTYHYLGLGDSYTIGEAVSPSESFPHQLSSLLSKPGVAVETQIIARPAGQQTNLYQLLRRNT